LSGRMIVVTGATGNVGRELVNLLQAAGEKVTAVTRNPSAAVLPAVPTWCAATRPPDGGVDTRRGQAVFLSPRAVGNGTAARCHPGRPGATRVTQSRQ
jgi:uncharacterized protein YbjT (DUF2867 family)